jgi:glyoxylase-like metal-dependent hydrolase (beta-lactamase superfamily II)
MMSARPRAAAAAVAEAILTINVEEDPQPRIEFAPGVWALPLRTRTLPPASCTNVWMPGGDRFVVIDPGSTDAEENDRLLRVVARRRAAGANVDAVVLTHHHRDHVGGAGAIAEALGVPVLAHPETLARLPALPAGVATRAISEGDALDLGGMRLAVLHTPGHAPGHLAFFDAARRVLIAGDLVSGLSTILVGFADGDMETYMGSLRRAAALDPRMVLASHGPPLPGRALAATIAHREGREAKVASALASEPRALAAIASDAYADSPQAPAFLREMQTRAHLRHLAQRGAAVAHDEDGSRWSR